MLTLKQARRMVAKSRRRVWRLLGYEPMGRTGHALARAEAASVSGPHRKAAGLLADELRARWDRLRGMEVATVERQWAKLRARAAALGVEDLPALDHGQDGDELLQDIADYYADIHPCPACGAEMEWEDCHHCGGEGGFDGDALMEEDPLWYDLDDYESCSECAGAGGWWHCYRTHEEAPNA